MQRAGAVRQRPGANGWHARGWVAAVLGVALVAAALAVPAAAGRAPIKLGVVVDITGGASSLGIPERNTFLLVQDRLNRQGGLAGWPVQYLIFDGETDPTKTTLAVKRLIEEEKVAAVICCTTSPASLAIVDTVQSARVPNVSLAAAIQIVEPVADRYWVFKTPQSDALVIDVLTDEMVRRGHRRIAWLGFADAYGQSAEAELRRLAPPKGIEVVAWEKYNRQDTDVTAQVTRAARARPDAWLIWAIPPGANVAHRNVRDLGLREPIYQSHGVANPTFLELGGPYVEGTILAVGKLLVAEQLPDSDPQKPVLLDYIRSYTERFGASTLSTFGGHALDASLLLHPALERVLARGVAPDDLAAFRAALRDELENSRGIIGITGIFNISSKDHMGLDRRALAVVTVEKGRWKLAGGN